MGFVTSKAHNDMVRSFGPPGPGGSPSRETPQLDKKKATHWDLLLQRLGRHCATSFSGANFDPPNDPCTKNYKGRVGPSKP